MESLLRRLAYIAEWERSQGKPLLWNDGLVDRRVKGRLVLSPLQQRKPWLICAVSRRGKQRINISAPRVDKKDREPRAPAFQTAKWTESKGGKAQGPRVRNRLGLSECWKSHVCQCIIVLLWDLFNTVCGVGPRLAPFYFLLLYFVFCFFNSMHSLTFSTDIAHFCSRICTQRQMRNTPGVNSSSAQCWRNTVKSTTRDSFSYKGKKTQKNTKPIGIQS